MPIPIIIEKIGGIERHYDIYSMMYKKRVVYLDEEITDATASAISAQLLFLEMEDNKKPIKMYINSPGGTVTAGLAIIDIMNHVSCPVETIVMGQACSMAAVILACGAKRDGTKNSRIMLHQPSAGTIGKVTEMEIAIEEGKKLKTMLNTMLSAITKQPLEKIQQSLENDFYMSVEEAKVFGVLEYVV
jgi:ATP-dependent Clp protease, protease subunit